jgi:transcriptional regulator with XRE-family HTH domain
MRMIHEVKIKDVKLELGALVKQLRKIEKLSQQELSEKLAVSRLTIQNLESGKNFTIDTLLKVFQYFNLLKDAKNFVDELQKNNQNIDSLY